MAILEKYAVADFEFTKWYWVRIEERQIDHAFLIKTFSFFDKIKLIEEDVLRYGDIGYDLYYELSSSRTLIIGVIPKKKLVFTHGILRYRNWQSALKREKVFKQ